MSPAVAAAESERRRAAGERFFGTEADRIARCCHRMAERFARGGRLVAFGSGPVARSDARHVAVEFVHPVIVGKRALPALALGAEGGPLAPQVALLVEPDDIVLGFGDDAETVAARDAARARGCLVLDLVPDEDDPFVRQELEETLYHVLWELVHVFFDHRGLLAGRTSRPMHDTGASSFLYPFFAEEEDDLEAVVTDVRASVLAKSEEISALREQTLLESAPVLEEAATMLRARFDAGGRVLALGNGGSATDAMDAVADLRSPPAGWTARPAIDLTEDPGILTAIANDVGVDSVFSRQVIAHGRGTDVLLAFSTSGGSANVLRALDEARRRGLATVAFVGYDGGQILADRLADHVVVTRSEHVPRIQEAQASAWHVLRALVEAVPARP